MVCSKLWIVDWEIGIEDMKRHKALQLACLLLWPERPEGSQGLDFCTSVNSESFSMTLKTVLCILMKTVSILWLPIGTWPY